MIVDKIENMGLYLNIPDYVVEFLMNLASDFETGKYELSKDCYVNVETYTTKLVEDAKFESHKNYIDIQLLLSGKERIFVEPVSDMLEILEEYNPEKDIMFYSDNVSGSDFVSLDGTNFVMLYPHEAHAPQVAITDVRSDVKKVVAKIRV